METTYSLRMLTPAYPFVTDNIKGTVYAGSDVSRTTPLKSEIDSTVSHPSKLWQFTGLEEGNYILSIDIVDENGTFLDNISILDITPNDFDIPEDLIKSTFSNTGFTI